MRKAAGMFGSENMISQFRGPWGVRVEIDQSLLILVGFLIYMSLGAGLIDGAIFAALLVGSILLHELGHAWGCLVQGIDVRRVVLHGGGGFCEHARSADRTEQELIIAMGPLVNLTLWAVCGVSTWLGWLFLPDTVAYDTALGMLTYDVLYYVSVLGWINGALFLFNMIPVQPLDGGRILHLLLLRVLPASKAHRVAGGVGLVLSVLWIPAAIFAYVTAGWILFFFPSPRVHWRMLKGQLASDFARCYARTC